MLKNNNGRSAARKPLAELSNADSGCGGGKPLRSCKKKTHENAAADGGLDRLLLLRSNLAGLVEKIDELVAQAINQKFSSENESQVVQSFGNALSDMISSLEPWFPRLRKIFSESTKAEACPGKSKDINPVSSVTNEEPDTAPTSKCKLDLDLVSPSPLVSWQLGKGKLENGRQLFLLTPIPKTKKLPPLQPGSPSVKAAKTTTDKAYHRTSELLPPNGHDDPAQKEVTLASHAPRPCQEQAEIKPENWLVAPVNLAVHKSKGSSIYLLTPCRKASQSKPSEQINGMIRNATLTENGLSSDDSFKGIASRYQELFGLKPTDTNLTFQRNEMDETLDWFLSPPKTCVLLEPSDSKVLSEPSDDKVLPTPCIVGASGKGMLLATPMWKDLDGTVQKSQLPGENTLKKELWTKFEAVSTNGLHFDASVFQETSRKGFMDMLEEASK